MANTGAEKRSAVLPTGTRNDPEGYLFEVAWEVCQQLGGIYTVIRSKIPSMIERWGERYLTVFNDSPEGRTATLTLDGLGAPTAARELVAGRDVAWTGGKAQVTLGPEDVAVIDLAPAPPVDSR